MRVLGSICAYLGIFGFTTLGQASQFVQPATIGAWKSLTHQYELVSLTADLSGFDESEKAALTKMVKATDLLHELYLRQVWDGSPALRAKLAKDKSAMGQLQLKFFDQNTGPWAQLHEEAPAFKGVPAKPAGSNYYPLDMKKDEFEKWVATLSESDRALATGCYTVIRRDGDKLKMIPYHEAYAEWVKPAAALLKEAAESVKNASLKAFLTSRADGLLTDNYFASDVDWLNLDSKIDITFGPYETYDDKLFGYKASYEAFIGIVDDADSKRLANLAGELQFLENNLPVADRYKNPTLGKASPIKIVNLIYSGGDARGGVMTAAFNLPNDEKVLAQHGSKKVMLKNVQKAKFEKILTPLAKLAVPKKELGLLDFEAFFTHILAHELAHGLGPHDIVVGGKKTTVRQELKEQYAAIEEAKADILGLWALEKLIAKGALPKKLAETMYPTYLASMFRSVRFGTEEAHGKGTALQFNYLLDKGAVKWNPESSTFSLNAPKVGQAVQDLTRELLTLQAEGSYAKAKQLLDKYAKVRPEMRLVLDKARSQPVDIEPRYSF
jgi:hypothetical protein